jgi:hypothetical protein
MPDHLLTKGDQARLRLRGAITTILMVALSVMIVRDIMVRRWASDAPPSPDVTRRSPRYSEALREPTKSP